MITREEFLKEVEMIAKELSVKAEDITIEIGDLGRYWGRCKPYEKKVMYDESLLSADKKFRYEVIIHELLHLRYHNHGRMFKTVLKAYLERCLKKFA